MKGKTDITAFYEIEPYSTILRLIKRGQANGISKRELCRITDLNERILRKSIETLRRNGVCILSGNAGYYKPLGKAEIERYIRRTERTARSTFYTLKTAKNELKRYEGGEV